MSFKGHQWNAAGWRAGLGTGNFVRRLSPRFQVIYYIYFGVTFAYTLYSSALETGLAGYLLKIELELFGRAEVFGTGLLMTFGWLVIFLVIAKIAGKFFPSLVWHHSDSTRITRRPGSITWKMILSICAIPILLGAVAAPAVYVWEHQDDHKQIYTLDLASPSAAPPKDAKFVCVTGVVARTYAVGLRITIKDSVSHERYVPITENGWTSGNPVRNFIIFHVPGSQESQLQWPEEVRRRGITQICGRIGGTLSTYVEGEFRSKGLKIAAPYSVITLEDLTRTSGFFWGDAIALIAVGIGFSIIIFAVMAAARVARFG